jgi:hypothetical protein
MTSDRAPTVDHVKGYCGLCIARCGTIATVADGRFIRLPFAPRVGRLPNWSTTETG